MLNLNIFGSNVWGGSVWAIYLVLGFLMKKMTFGRIPSSVLLIIFLGSFCASSFLRYLEFCRTGTASAAYGSGFVIIPAFSLFLFLLRFRGKIDKVPHIVVVFFTNISLYAFSIYMIHIWVKDVLQKCFITYNVDIYNTGLFYVPTIVLTILISLGIALAISRVTFLRKWLLLVK